LPIRLDRALTLYAVWPLLRLLRANRQAIPILMYHSVSEALDSAQNPYYRIVTSPTAFLAQMQLLHENGYTSCTPGAVAAQVRSRSTALNQVSITFDDGYRDFLENAQPVLQRFGFTATLYLPTGSIGREPLVFNSRPCLTWSQVRELQQRGVELGSHTVTHPQLRNMPREVIRAELAESKKKIEDETGQPVESFAYPYAFPQTDRIFKADLREMLAEAGYTDGVCTSVARAISASDPFFLPRLPVNDEDSPGLFQAKLAGAYDWFGAVQGIAKSAKVVLGDWAVPLRGQPVCSENAGNGWDKPARPL